MALNPADASPGESALFLPPDDAVTPDTGRAILEVAPRGESESPAPIARRYEFAHDLSIPQGQDIVGNARRRDSALLFHQDRGAFIVLGSARAL